MDTNLNNSVVQGFRVLLKLLPDDEVDLIVSEGAESFGLKFVSILHNDLSLFEMHRDLTGGKVNVWRAGTESSIKTLIVKYECVKLEKWCFGISGEGKRAIFHPMMQQNDLTHRDKGGRCVQIRSSLTFIKATDKIL